MKNFLVVSTKENRVLAELEHYSAAMLLAAYYSMQFDEEFIVGHKPYEDITEACRFNYGLMTTQNIINKERMRRIILKLKVIVGAEEFLNMPIKEKS